MNCLDGTDGGLKIEMWMATCALALTLMNMGNFLPG